MIDPETCMTIPIDVVLDLPSVDAVDSFLSDQLGHDGGPWGSVRSTMARKLTDVTESYDWDQDSWEQTDPIHLFIGEPELDPYTKNGVPQEYVGKLIMGNGHHRVAFLNAKGAKYVWFTWDYSLSR